MTVTLAGKRMELTTCPRCHGDGFRMREFAGDVNKPGSRNEMKTFKMECKKCRGRGYTRK